MARKIKVMTIFGTRPEIIRLSRVIAELDRHVDHIIVHTGQNYDAELKDVFFEDLKLREPDYNLNVDPASLGSVLGHVLIKTEEVLLKENPDAVLILGDTNSSISAIMAKRMRVPVYHMEAGNRCFDPNVPEETNRQIVDRIADFNLVYTEHARRHLLSEGLPHRRIYLTGSPMGEVLAYYSRDIEQSTVLAELDLKPGKYFVVSIHREENVDNPGNLQKIIDALHGLIVRFDLPVIFSTHPRTRKRIEQQADRDIDSRIRLLKPFGYFDYNKLQTNAFCVLSDSGTISEEAAICGFPAVTVRNAMERPESLDSGSIMITGLDADTIIEAVALVTAQHRDGRIPPVPDEYRITNVSQRVVRLIVGTAGLSNAWAGIDPAL